LAKALHVPGPRSLLFDRSSMPQRKKAKTSHRGNHSIQANGGALTHDEIWDDSALIRSWDAAVEEYKVDSPTNHATFAPPSSR
jgi:hypothetical protein